MKSLDILLRTILTGVILHFCQPLLAQNKTATGLEIEADPIAYILSGYSFHLAYTFPDVRVSAGIFGIDNPDFLLNNDAFSVFSSGYDIKADYLFGQLKGFFVGTQITYGKERIELKEARIQNDFWDVTFGLRGGYRFTFGKARNNYKGLYLVPWIALTYTPGAETVQMGGEEYSQAAWAPFPTVHIGWRF